MKLAYDTERPAYRGYAIGAGHFTEEIDCDVSNLLVTSTRMLRLLSVLSSEVAMIS